MSRYPSIKLPAEHVDTFEVAPHRYTWDGANDVDGEPSAMTLREWREKLPYKAGEVVYVVYGEGFAKAYISGVSVGYDGYGDRQPRFRVHRATKKGHWSKLYYVTYAGFIQCGYRRAGLAPDMPAEINRSGIRGRGE